MKIGILTLPFNNNYGGYLQAYALMTVLKEMGHEVELIYRRHNKIPVRKIIILKIKNIVKVIFGRKDLSVIPNVEKAFRARGISMMPFLDNRITPKSKPLYSTKAFNDYVSGRFDAVIVGSDQVWRPEYGPNIRDYFFCGVPDNNLIRLSYAASFGTDKPLYTEEDIIACGKALAKFKAVSVREESGLKILNEMYSKIKCTPELVLDPTLLLQANNYNSIIPKGDAPSKDKVFCYVLDTDYEKEKIMKMICDNLHKERYAISDIQKNDTLLPSVESWLSAIRDSDFVITDSFHGMAFSVIFHKEFVVCPNVQRGADRFVSFLNICGIHNRILSNTKNIESIIQIPIDWEAVEKNLHIHRYNSSLFLKLALA